MCIRIGKAKPTRYITFPPDHYTVGRYNVTHNISNCTSSTVRMGNEDQNVITCPYGELLLDGITQTDLEDDVTNKDIQTFYTWNHASVPDAKTFVTLQFPNTITPSKVAVHCLRLNNLNVSNPSRIRLFSSNTTTIFPNKRIPSVDHDKDVVNKSGRTSENDEYEYRRYDLKIPKQSQVPLNTLRVLLKVRQSSWMFISEVEVFYLTEQCKFVCLVELLMIIRGEHVIPFSVYSCVIICDVIN